MGILFDIWRTFFGKQKKQDQTIVADEVTEQKQDVVYNEIFVSQVNSQKSEESNLKKALPKRVKGFKNFTKEQAVLKYILEHGSIDKITCFQKFGLKRLDNVICEFRKQGMSIKNEDIFLHNENGQKIKVNNYILVTEDGAN